MHRYAFPLSLNIYQVHVTKPEESLIETVFLPVRFPEERDAFPPY